MDIQEELVQYAKALPHETRLSILMAFPEAKLHKHVKALFERMEPSYRTAITYGVNGHGKDLVIVKKITSASMSRRLSSNAGLLQR